MYIKDMKTKNNKIEMWGFLHNNKPAPFNPDFDPKASERFHKVSASMMDDNFYANHTREECKVEWRRRYDEFKKKGF
jgi:hypothetical protein